MKKHERMLEHVRFVLRVSEGEPVSDERFEEGYNRALKDIIDDLEEIAYEGKEEK